MQLHQPATPAEQSPLVQSLLPSTQGDRWIDNGAVLLAQEAWETDAVGEPSVILVGSTLIMFYSGGGGTSRIGRATSTDGLTWTRDADFVIGGGEGGEAGLAARANVFAIGNTLYLSYNNLSNDPNGSIYLVQSVDNGVTWTGRTQILARTATKLWGNRRVIQVGSTLYMFAELEYVAPATLKASGYAGQNIEIYTCAASDPFGTWSYSSGPFQALQTPGSVIDSTSTTSPGSVIVANNRYNMWPWCHHAVGDYAGTEIYFSSSANMTTWAPPIRLWRAKDTTYNGNPVLQHADVCVLEAFGKSFIYYTVVVTGFTHVACRSYNGAIEKVVAELDNIDVSVARTRTAVPTPDYWNGGNYAWLDKNDNWTLPSGAKVKVVSGMFNLTDFATRSLQLSPPVTDDFNPSIRLEGGITGHVAQQYKSSGVATAYYGNAAIKTCGSGVASGKLRYRFSAAVTASAGDVIVMSPSGHTFVVDDNVVNATSFAAGANSGGITVREVLGGGKPTTSDTSLTVNGGAPITTTFQINSATNADNFDAFIFWASSLGVMVYSPVYGGVNTRYTITGF